VMLWGETETLLLLISALISLCLLFWDVQVALNESQMLNQPNPKSPNVPINYFTKSQPLLHSINIYFIPLIQHIPIDLISSLQLHKLKNLNTPPKSLAIASLIPRSLQKKKTGLVKSGKKLGGRNVRMLLKSIKNDILEVYLKNVFI
jgi:hypothetical protein